MWLVLWTVFVFASGVVVTHRLLERNKTKKNTYISHILRQKL